MASVTAHPAPRVGWLDNYFGVTARSSTVRNELLGGLATFLVSAYIIFVNPLVLSFRGDPTLRDSGKGPDFFATLAVTCLVAGVLTLTMGLWARYPFMLAPGMGLNSVVAYQLVVGAGLTWQAAMGVIVLEGILITILVLTGLRQAVMHAVPMRLKRAIAVGIGLFIFLIGLVNGGFVKMSGVAAAPLTLGSLATATFLVTIFGLLVTLALQARQVKGSLLWGILGATVFSVFVNSFTGAYKDMPGVAVLPTQVVSLPNFSNLGAGLNLMGAFVTMGLLAALLAVFSLMLADFFDTMGTLVGVGKQAGFLDEGGNYPPEDLRRLLLVDSAGPIVGGLAGASSATTYIESAAGVSEGARTGLAAVVTGCLFLMAMFFSPLAGVIPPQATAPALLIVGFLMVAHNLRDIVQDFPSLSPSEMVVEGFPALVALFGMAASYSITTGIGWAFVTYAFLRLVTGRGVHWMMWISSAAFLIYFFFSR